MHSFHVPALSPKSDCNHVKVLLQQRTVCALSQIRARRMLAFLKGRDVGNRHMPHHCHSLAARAACNWVVLYFCHCLANNVRHQYAPTLGHAIRIGEAKNPGPNRGTCLINMVLANPTSLANKKDTLTQLLTRTSKCTVLGRNFCHRRNTVTMPTGHG